MDREAPSLRERVAQFSRRTRKSLKNLRPMNKRIALRRKLVRNRGSCVRSRKTAMIEGERTRARISSAFKPWRAPTGDSRFGFWLEGVFGPRGSNRVVEALTSIPWLILQSGAQCQKARVAFTGKPQTAALHSPVVEIETRAGNYDIPAPKSEAR